MDDDKDNGQPHARSDRRTLSLVRCGAAQALPRDSSTTFASIRCAWSPGHSLNKRVAPGRALKKVAAPLQNDRFDSYRQLLFDDVWHRFGPEAAEHLATRMRFATGAQVIAWARRATFMLAFPELLEPVPLAVYFITPALLLKHAFSAVCGEPAVLLRFDRCSDHHADRLLLCERAPWFLDLPHPDRAIASLRLRGWLLFACEDASQAELLVGATLECRRLAVSLIVPSRLAGESEADIQQRYLRPVRGRFERCFQ